MDLYLIDVADPIAIIRIGNLQTYCGFAIFPKAQPILYTIVSGVVSMLL